MCWAERDRLRILEENLKREKESLGSSVNPAAIRLIRAEYEAKLRAKVCVRKMNMRGREKQREKERARQGTRTDTQIDR